MFAQLSSIDISKACGPDAIPGFLLKASAEFISSPLRFLFTKSLHTATLPKDWVTANIVPVFKQDDCSVVKNYRPISLTSLVIKAMERIIYSNIASVLESHNRISPCQFGFRKGCSTSHSLLFNFSFIVTGCT